jgi:GalNAc-alpha-(1->4)-GalNAc-alpha-(1->3)-diNAcBac-PP-undecaprenol alpha-1,4-N-acetyl-D-galactosaminyltransferase
VIGEAMSAGLPVIAYDCVAGPSDLVDDGNTGFLTSPFEDITYAQKLKLLVNNADLRIQMGRKGRKKIQEFQVDNITEEFYSFILNSEQIVRDKNNSLLS